MTIVPDGNCLGRANIGSPLVTAAYWANHVIPSAPVAVKREVVDGLLHDAAKRVVVALMAGHEAELALLGDANDWNAHKDELAICEILYSILLINGHYPYYTHLRSATRRLVRKHRSVIERIAAALIEHRTLSVEQVDRLIA